MITTTVSRDIRKYLYLLFILVLVFPSSMGSDARAAGIQQPALVRVDLSSPYDLRTYHSSGYPAVAYLTSSSGEAYLLALLSPEQSTGLASRGLELTTLDPDSQSASYYLVHEKPGPSLEAALLNIAVLQRDGLEVLVRAEPEQAEKLRQGGIRIAPLGPGPIILPLESGSVFTPTPLPDLYIAGIINRVSQADILAYMQELTGAAPAHIGGSPYTITTRNTYSGEPIQKAAQYVYEHFQSFGLEAEYHTWSDPAYPNVIGSIQGAGQPERIVLITAHLDNMPKTGPAPGADDNASGVSAVMVAAKLLSQYSWDCTLRFAAFTGEEQGLLGSSSYAARSFNQGENIAGLLNLDMIAYDSDAYPIVDLHSRSALPGSVEIAYLFSSVVNAYDINLTPHVLINDSLGNYSDNKSFWDKGYPAVLGIEDYDDFMTGYHTPMDTIDSLNMEYFTNFVKASVGTLAHMGCLLQPGALAGTVTAKDTGLPLPGVEVEASLSSKKAIASSSEMDGSYEMPLNPGPYLVTASLPEYKTFTTCVTIAPGELVMQDVSLQPEIIPAAPASRSGPGTYTDGALTVSIDPAHPLPGQVVTFSAGIPPGPLPATYSWSFGDGTPPRSGPCLTQTTHAFPRDLQRRVYTLSLRAANAESAWLIEVPIPVYPVQIFLPQLEWKKTGLTWLLRSGTASCSASACSVE